MRSRSPATKREPTAKLAVGGVPRKPSVAGYSRPQSCPACKKLWVDHLGPIHLCSQLTSLRQKHLVTIAEKIRLRDENARLRAAMHLARSQQAYLALYAKIIGDCVP